ncbi:MAG: excinuclease ABC subunit UvrA, partial [Gammaproteobacteria bacterium]|nr:excinuclease ABC subunit UvrA [Gammaproteobacteria bacterium]
MSSLPASAGAGKSSLAFDTLYAEGQRRYVESLSSYARQFMDQMEKPRVDQITGLSPTIAIEQKTVSRNPRSTVGTITEVLDYLRVLYARAGDPHCPQCGRSVRPQSPQQISNQLLEYEAGTRFQVMAPIVRKRKGTHQKTLQQAVADGYSRARIDGEQFDLTADGIPELDKKKKHDVYLVVDRLIAPEQVDEQYHSRLMDTVETSLRAADGVMIVRRVDTDEEIVLSEHHACPVCDLSFPELEPNMFSFNSPLGMCPECNGLGVKLQVDPELIITQPDISLLDGASAFHGELRKSNGSRWRLKQMSQLAEHYGIDLEQPWKDLPEKFRNVVLYGSEGEKIRFNYKSEDGSWTGESYTDAKGCVFHINRLFRQTKSEGSRRYYMSFMSRMKCPACQGERLTAHARYVFVGGKSLPEISKYSISELFDWVQGLMTAFSEEQREIAGELVAEIRDRLHFMMNVGLHYL